MSMKSSIIINLVSVISTSRSITASDLIKQNGSAGAQSDVHQVVFALSAARLPVTAWKPDLMLATEQREPHNSHCRKYRRVSRCNIVSGDLHVWHVTYSSATDYNCSVKTPNLVVLFDRWGTRREETQEARCEEPREARREETWAARREKPRVARHEETREVWRGEPRQAL